MPIDPMNRLGWKRTDGLPPLVILTLACLATSACDEGPLVWENLPDTVILRSVNDPALNYPSVLDVIGGVTYRVESVDVSGAWDVGLVGLGDDLALAAPGWMGIKSEARIARIPSTPFEDVRVAPADTSAYTDRALELEFGDVYVIRSREAVNSSGTACNYFAKLYPLTTVPQLNQATLVYAWNPYCGSRSLEPGG